MVSAVRDGDNYSWRIWEDDDLLEVAATLADTLGCGSVSPSPVKTPPRPLSTPPPTALQGGKYFSFPGEVSIASAKSVQSPLDSQGRLYGPSSTGWATPPGPGPSSRLAHSDGNTLAGGSFIMPRRACVCVQVCVSVASQPFPATLLILPDSECPEGLWEGFFPTLSRSSPCAVCVLMLSFPSRAAELKTLNMLCCKSSERKPVLNICLLLNDENK